MTEPAHAQELVKFSANPRLKVILTTDAGSPAEDAAITELRLYAPETDRMKNFPARVSRLSNLKVLALGPSIDKSMLAQLGPGAIPPGVETLKVFTGTVAAAWPQALLAEVQLLTVPGNGVFERMKHLPLQRLGLLGGTIETLEGIQALPRVNWLLLHNLKSLKSIRAITALQHLEEVQIRYCKKIQDIACLAELPRLRRLEVIACGNLGLAKIKPFLDKLEKVMLSASS
jgi:hypothetical protein